MLAVRKPPTRPEHDRGYGWNPGKQDSLVFFRDLFNLFDDFRRNAGTLDHLDA